MKIKGWDTYLKKWKEFIYAHKHGIMGTLIFHLLLAIGLLSMGISKMNVHKEVEIVLEMPEPEVIQQMIEEKKELIRQRANDEVEEMLRSIAVNEEVKNEKRPDREPIENVQEYIKEIQEELKGSYGNRYETKKDKHYKTDSLQHAKDEQQRKLDSLQSIVYVGKSSVSYKLEGRYKVFLPIPIFKCEYGGKVVVAIVVNQKGHVVKAEVIDKESKQDDCLRDVAVDAALRSRFNQDDKASEYQTGTITYNFVKQ
ncbi:energy transducer TonB [uncultured Sanguibacteroides sp.]|uniref:energy transducer TonB n=1 Tax=uncultured Sanguibacteroides sp. TaxID=1635151 RepID=UPI0025FE73C5|nr:energy transducer TonB [uncultured Sanguibacteroides sp.]